MLSMTTATSLTKEKITMTNNKAKKATFKTPLGIAQYPWLNNPDTQFDSAGQYKVNLRLSQEEAKPLMDEVKKAAKAAFGDKAKSATLPFVKDEETGDVIIKTKSKVPAVQAATALARPFRPVTAEHLRRVRDEAGWNPVSVPSRWPSRHLHAAWCSAAD